MFQNPFFSPSLLLPPPLHFFLSFVFSGFLPPGPVECILCNNTCFSLRGLRQHLQSREHVEREKELFSEDLEKDNVTFFMREPRKI